MDEFLSKFGITKTSQTLVIPEKQERDIYIRVPDPDLEIILALKQQVATCDSHIETKSSTIATLDTRVKELKRKTQGLSATSPQVAQIKTKAVAHMQEAKRLEEEIKRRKQMKATLEKQIANMEQVREAKEIQRLMKESTTRMQIALGEMDSTEVAAIGKDARKVDRSAGKVADSLLNPFGEDVTEMDNELASAFDALELSDEESISIVTTLPPSRLQPATTTTKRRGDTDLLDDLF